MIKFNRQVIKQIEENDDFDMQLFIEHLYNNNGNFFHFDKEFSIILYKIFPMYGRVCNKYQNSMFKVIKNNQSLIIQANNFHICDIYKTTIRWNGIYVFMTFNRCDIDFRLNISLKIFTKSLFTNCKINGFNNDIELICKEPDQCHPIKGNNSTIRNISTLISNSKINCYSITNVNVIDSQISVIKADKCNFNYCKLTDVEFIQYSNIKIKTIDDIEYNCQLEHCNILIDEVVSQEIIVNTNIFIRELYNLVKVKTLQDFQKYLNENSSLDIEYQTYLFYKEMFDPQGKIFKSFMYNLFNCTFQPLKYFKFVYNQNTKGLSIHNAKLINFQPKNMQIDNIEYGIKNFAFVNCDIYNIKNSSNCKCSFSKCTLTDSSNITNITQMFDSELINVNGTIEYIETCNILNSNLILFQVKNVEITSSNILIKNSIFNSEIKDTIIDFDYEIGLTHNGKETIGCVSFNNCTIKKMKISIDDNWNDFVEHDSQFLMVFFINCELYLALHTKNNNFKNKKYFHETGNIEVALTNIVNFYVQKGVLNND